MGSNVLTMYVLAVTLLLYFGGTECSNKPNIIFILTDDQGSADVGYVNPGSKFVTNNIDKIAANSIRLKNYYVHPTCTPTRAALMTGRYAANVGLSMALLPGNPAGLDKMYQTLPEHLARDGYKNYLVGKWHLGQSKKMYHPLERGFHEFYGLLGGGFNHYTKQQGSGRVDFWRGYDPVFENQTHSTDLLNDEALKIVKRHTDKNNKDPFFLYLAYPAVHDPLAAPERHQDQCGHILNTKRMLSCAMVAGIDEGVGRIRDQLEKTGVLDDTIIVFSVDNGGVPYAGALNYPLRGAKTTLYEGGVRSPGFIHAPNIFSESYDYHDLFHVSDFFPTLATMVMSSRNKSADVVQMADMDGVDHFLAMESKKQGPRKNVHIHRDWDRDGHAYRRGPWKIIVGHHCLPFFFTEVYNETNSRWLVENGSLRDKALQIVTAASDALLGTENTLFEQYLFWIIFDSFNVGGLRRARASAGTTTTELHQVLYKSDLERFLTEQNKHPEYPLVSLFNLDEDPQEAFNLATKFPELVRELLEEAEEVLKKAPDQWRGDVIDADAPVSGQEGWISDIRTLGTHYEFGVPFGIYLDDDVDLKTLNYTRMLDNQPFRGFIILTKMFLTFLILPCLILMIIFKYMQ